MSHQDAARRRFDLLLEHAAEFAGVAVKNIRAEFPSFIKSVMRQPGDFPQRPGIGASRPASLFTPAFVSDDSDGQIAHLHGLNLSRAWCWRRLAELLPAGDPRVPVITDAAARHAEPELAHASGSDYMVEHWLAAYAVLYLT